MRTPAYRFSPVFVTPIAFPSQLAAPASTSSSSLSSTYSSSTAGGGASSATASSSAGIEKRTRLSEVRLLGGAATSSGVGGASFGSTGRFSFRRCFRAGFATDGGRFSSSSSSSSSSSHSSPSACASSSATPATSIAGSRSAVASATAARH